jgi:hypothetical protein
MRREHAAQRAADPVPPEKPKAMRLGKTHKAAPASFADAPLIKVGDVLSSRAEIEEIENEDDRITLVIQASNLLLKKANLPAAIPWLAEHSLLSLSALSVRSSGTDDGKRPDPNSAEDRWDEQVSSDVLSGVISV